jgi:hypothetical protein
LRRISFKPVNTLNLNRSLSVLSRLLHPLIGVQTSPVPCRVRGDGRAFEQRKIRGRTMVQKTKIVTSNKRPSWRKDRCCLERVRTIGDTKTKKVVTRHFAIGIALLVFSAASTLPAVARTSHHPPNKHVAWNVRSNPLYLYGGNVCSKLLYLGCGYSGTGPLSPAATGGGSIGYNTMAEE